MKFPILRRTVRVRVVAVAIVLSGSLTLTSCTSDPADTADDPVPTQGSSPAEPLPGVTAPEVNVAGEPFMLSAEPGWGIISSAATAYGENSTWVLGTFSDGTEPGSTRMDTIVESVRVGPFEQITIAFLESTEPGLYEICVEVLPEGSEDGAEPVCAQVVVEEPA